LPPQAATGLIQVVFFILIALFVRAQHPFALTITKLKQSVCGSAASLTRDFRFLEEKL
jgi:hypothetical protein